MQAEATPTESEAPPQEASVDEKAGDSSADATVSNQPPAEDEADNASAEVKGEEADLKDEEMEEGDDKGEIKDEEMEEGDDKDEVKNEEEVDEEMVDEENIGEMEDEEMADVKDELDAKEEDGEDETVGVDGEVDGGDEEVQKGDDAAQEEEPKEEPKPPEPKPPEPPKELEEDDVDDQREKVERSVVAWSSVDTTMNAVLGADGHLLMPVTDGGCQFLDTGVRSTIGLKAGRYFFEATIIENLVRQANVGMVSNQFVRIGVTLADSTLFMGYSKESVCFDSHGFFWRDGEQKQATASFGRGTTVGLLVNLDASSKNANTVSLFRNGFRASPPRDLPESFHGKVLHPTITFKGMTLHANLGPLARAPLPFKCRMVQDAAAADVEIKPQPSQQETCEVIFPVGLPGEGAFDYMDFFCRSRPYYTELSDRKILDWGYQSCLHNSNGGPSRDKPDIKMGLPTGMDGNSMRAMLTGLAPFVRRNFIVMELRGNLLEQERRKRLQHWGASHRKIALVLIGEPTDDYKEWVHSIVLAEKQRMMDMMKMAKQQQPAASSPQKSQRSEAKVEEGKKEDSNDLETKNESKSSTPEDSEKANDEQTKEGDTSKEPASSAEDTAKEQPEEGTQDGEKKTEGEDEAKEAPVELSEEEKKAWHRKTVTPDMAEGVIATNYVSFSLPTEEEGFDEIRYVWRSKEESETYIQKWIRQQKQTQYATNLQPSAAFKGDYDTWNKLLLGWKQAQMDFRSKQDKSKNEKKADEEKKAEDDADDVKEEEPKKTEEEKRRIFEDLDIETVEDINNVDGAPLFQYFAYEDWVLLRLRYELHLLIHAYREDLNDPDRPSFRESHLAYVYAKYFQKQIALKTFDVSTVKDLVELIEDTIGIEEENDMLKTLLPKDTPPEKFVKLTEEHRRDRARRVDAGDESAALNFQSPNDIKLQQAQSSQQWPQGKGGFAPMAHQGKGVWPPVAMQAAMMANLVGMANSGAWGQQVPPPQAQHVNPAPPPPAAPSNPLLNVMKRLGEAQKGKSPQVLAPPGKPFQMPKQVAPPPGNWGQPGAPTVVGTPAPKVGQKKPRPPSHPPTHAAKAMPTSKRQRDTGSSGSSRDANRNWDANKNQDQNKKDSWDKNKGGSWDAKSWDAQKKDSWASSSKTTVPTVPTVPHRQGRPSMAPASAPPPPPPSTYPPHPYDARYMNHGQSHGQSHGQNHGQSHSQSHSQNHAQSQGKGDAKRRKKGK